MDPQDAEVIGGYEMKFMDRVKRNLAWSGVMMAAVLGVSAAGGSVVWGAARTAVQADVATAAGTVQVVAPTERGTLTCTADKTNVNITGAVSGAVSDPAV